MFFDSGFHDVCHESDRGFSAMQLAELGAYVYLDAGYPAKRLLTHDMLPWLKQHGLLEQSPTDPLGTKISTAATGWHTPALRLGNDLPSWNYGGSATPLPPLDVACGLFRDLFRARRADSCRCACNNSGCLPSTVFFKAIVQRRNSLGYNCYTLLYRQPTWDAFQNELVSELLRYLTFEALERTHTCCAGGAVPHPVRTWTCTMQTFGGSLDDIHDEEGELLARLQALL